jgi:tRNA 2-thiouridine synthesizing protein A
MRALEWTPTDLLETCARRTGTTGSGQPLSTHPSTERRLADYPGLGPAGDEVLSSAVTDTLEYDATGLLCPLPVLRANRKLRELPVGGLLTVRATDPAAEQDFPAFCRQTGHELVSTSREGEVLVFVIRKR